jgi:DNA helicase-2/ATP-dependent DNA helicase PcrA
VWNGKSSFKKMTKDDSMSLIEQDWINEQQRVDEISGKINKQIIRLQEELGLVKSDAVDIRKNFWDGVTINLNNSDDLGETHFSMKQQADVLSERERMLHYSNETLDKLNRLIRTPYFGRIDFREVPSQAADQIYLGIASFLDDDNMTFLIYDWRAPISSLYYDYSPGPVKYMTPVGEVQGEMSLKRQYLIRDSEIQFMFDTSVTIGDQLLQRALSRSSDAQMKSIVATIQKEQNQIIRNDRSRMLVVQGAAGSGKTSAALQRVAYLLYKYRKTLRADQMLLLSPNPMFNSYVSTVLPELGEENMQQTTFQEYLEHRLHEEFELEDPFTQLEYVLSSTEERPGYLARISGIRYKSSVHFLQAIRAYKDALERDNMLFKPISFRGTDMITAAQIKEKFYAYDPAVNLANRIELLREWLLKELRAYERTLRHQAWVDEAIQHLDIDDYQYAYKRMLQTQKGKGVTFDDLQKEHEFLAKIVIQDRLRPLRRWIKRLRFVDVLGLYCQLFSNEPFFSRVTGQSTVPYWKEICRQTIDKLTRSELPYEDTTPYLYLKELVQGFQTNTSIRYVLVDEAQDYSPFQLEFLKQLFPRCRMTALGDLNQAIYAHSSVLHEFDAITGLYGPDETEIIRLTRSYRSTREIVEFTRRMVEGGEAIVPFNRSGAKPEVIYAVDNEHLHAQIVNAVKQFSADGYDSIAIICKTASECMQVFEALGEQLPLLLITKHTLAFEKGVQVIPAYLAKGVEFDAVLIYNASAQHYSREDERKLFYTACTRAMHFLQIYAVGALSPFISCLDEALYNVK